MEKEDATLFRRAVARLNYMSLDRPDLAAVSNMLARRMATPKVGDEKLVKRSLRYLHGTPRCRLMYKMQDEVETVSVKTDSDWAGCKLTRKSTSGVVIELGTHLLTFSSRTQTGLALSSGEAELNAQVSGISEALGMANILRELWGSTHNQKSLRFVGSSWDSHPGRGWPGAAP